MAAISEFNIINYFNDPKGLSTSLDKLYSTSKEKFKEEFELVISKIEDLMAYIPKDLQAVSLEEIPFKLERVDQVVRKCLKVSEKAEFKQLISKGFRFQFTQYMSNMEEFQKKLRYLESEKKHTLSASYPYGSSWRPNNREDQLFSFDEELHFDPDFRKF